MAKKRVKRNNKYYNTYSIGGPVSKFANWNEAATNKFMGSNFGKSLGKLGVSSSGIGGIANAATSIVGGLMNPKGNSTGAGNVLQGIGSAASNIPGIGGLIGAGVNLFGGLVNAAFGSKLNDEFINQTEDMTNQHANYVSSASDNASLLSDWASHADLAHVSKSDVGSDGWFSNKAKNKTKELNRAIDDANLKAWSSLSNTASNIDTNNALLAMANYSAYGGPIFSTGAIGYDLASRDLNNKQMKALGDMRLTSLPNSFNAMPDVNTINTFKDGGIFIKPENRGKFTALKERTGKSSTWYKEHGTPAQKKMATFALNAAKWKHADGGPVKKADYDSWYKTIPTDRNDTTSYNLRRAYELAPYSELEAWRTSSPKDLKNGKNHLRSVYLNPKTGVYEFMKSKNHPTLHFETEWYNSNDPEAIDFRKNYMLDTSGEYYRYIPRKKAFGGELNTQGGDFTNGLTYIDNGGSHEANPFEGVQMGIDPQGVPNLVEEGEVIFNDYVFSNRLKVPKAIRQKYKLRDNITFAEAAKKLSKESEERPNDSISQRGLETFMSALANSQEEMRIKSENKRMNRYAKGGKLGNLFEGPGSEPNSLLPEWAWLGSNFNRDEYETTKPEDDDTDDVTEVRGIRQNPLRYAPIIGSGIAVLNDMFGGNNPDYSNADLFANAIRNVNKPVSARPIGEYLPYEPLDRMFYINQLNKSTAANRRAIQDTSGGNRAAALAGILASDYDYGENLGKLARQAEEYNQAQREKVATFNRQTNTFNSEQGTKVDMFNTELLGKQATMYGQLANMKQNILENNRAEKSANLTNFIQGLGDLGREATDRDTLRWLADIGALPYNARGQYIGGNNTAAPKRSKGGKIKRNKGRGYTV